MKIKKLHVVLLLALIFAGTAGAQKTFEPTPSVRRQAFAQGQVKEYLAAMEILASEAEKKGRWADASVAYYEASLAARQMSQYQKAISFALRAKQLGERVSDPYLQTNAISALAIAYRAVRQFDSEREWLQKGIETSRQIQNVSNRDGLQTRLSRALGVNFLQQDEIEKAIEYISYSVQGTDSVLGAYKRLRVSQEVIQQQEFNLIGSLGELGTAYLRGGKNREAINAFDRGVAIAKASKSHTSEADLLIGLGRAYAAEKDFSRAMDNFNNALRTAEAAGQASAIEGAVSGIADVFVQTQRPAEAIPFYKKAIDGIESTRSLLDSEEFRTSFFAGKGDIYGGLIAALVTSSNIEEAFNYNERARSRAFLDILGSKVQLGRRTALIEEERALEANLAELRQRAAAGRGGVSETPSGGAPVRQEIVAAEKAYAEFLGKVRSENKEQASLMNVEPLTLKQVQELLDLGVTLLEYFVSQNSISLWVAEKDSTRFVDIPVSRKDLASRVGALRDLLSQFGEQEKVNAALRDFHSLLIAPALSHIHGKKLIIVPHDVLHYLPFQALFSPDGHYLIENYSISYLSSASLLQFVKEKRRSGGEKVIAVGNPDFGDPKMSLRFAELEAKEVQKLYPQATVLLAKEATKERAKALSPSGDIIHFATHAELNEDDPLSSAILLAKTEKDDGRLEVREIFAMQLRANLVVLSACETGLGKLSGGDELVGLTRAFIYAGTPSVVASLWSVEDSSTAELMASFYRNLKTMSKVEALRQAQLQLLRERRRIGEGEAAPPSAQSAADSVSLSTAHPYFWAAFTLVGDGS